MTVYIVDLESIPTRYTCEWKTFLPALIKKYGHEVEIIDGPDNLPNNTTPGMFLNFSATNIYKSVQVEKFSKLFSDGKIKDGDYFLFTDAWHPGVINLKYMADLLGINIKIGGCWHSGSYDKWDGLGRLIGDKPWVRHAEQSFYHAIDHNYFATEFHIDLFAKTHGKDAATEFWKTIEQRSKKVVRTGWPMEYMENILVEYKGMQKRDLILFPHRIAPEKQVEIFRDLKEQLPQYEFIVCQDQYLTKNEYHNLLGEAKIVFSANLQETLGISTCSEGPLLNSIPLAPDRLSYSEIFKNHQEFLYPSVWTESWDQYHYYKTDLINRIIYIMENYKTLLPIVVNYNSTAYRDYFTAQTLIDNIK